MNKYFLQPVLFDSFLTGNFLLKKISAFVFFLSLLFSFNNVSAQWIDYQLGTGLFPNDAVFVNDNTGWICGNSGYVVKTTNKGVNWVNQTVQAGMSFERLHFINENTGMIFGEDSYMTTNAGLNWNAIPSLDAMHVQSISFTDNLTGWAGALFGRTFKTTNGGLNWSLQLDLGGSGFSSIAGASSSTAFAIRSSQVYKTTNGGTNWNVIASVPGGGLGNISFSDENNGRMFGTFFYYKTTNGGQNWFEWELPGGASVRSQYFLNASLGWVTTATSIYFTENGGSSWQQQTSNNMQGSAIYSYNGSIVCAVGRITSQNMAIASVSTTGGLNLSAPSNLSITKVSSSQLNLSWTDNSNEDYVLIERSPNGATGWILTDSVDGWVTSYQNTGLNSDQGYYYRVRGRKIIFYSGYSGVASARTYMNSPALVFPENNAVTPIGVLQWSTVPNGFHYTVQVASDSNFSTLVYTTTTSATSVNPVTIQNSTKYYWRVKTAKFDASNESQYSAYRSFVFQNPNYGHNMSSGNNLYYFANSTTGSNPSPSKPTYNWRDTTGSTNLILNRVAQVTPSMGNVDDGRFDITGQLPGGNSIRFFGMNYQNVYIGTNGIIAFAQFNPILFGNYEPNSSLPQPNIINAVFPFWKDLNFSDVDVPVNRLCYKITSDEIIITYMRAPDRNLASDVNDYVSFQIIINHSVSPSANSNILIMYNDDQTGSSFKTKYNNNTLEQHLIGLQGANSSSQFLQYRYLNSTPQLISPGPMFGSNLALAFSSDQNTLPVELASFTSTVNANNVQLNWSTAMEENNSGFDVERCELSIVNGEWKKVGNVQGNGTTNEAKNYSYEDRNVQSGNYKYRLKQIDYNGNFEYHELSNEVIVGVPNKYSLSQNYPNPFNPVTKINFEVPKTMNGQLANVKLIVYDVTGRMITELVNKQMEAGYYTVDFNAVNLSSGIYFYRLAANDFVQTKKMVLMK